MKNFETSVIAAGTSRDRPTRKWLRLFVPVVVVLSTLGSSLNAVPKAGANALGDVPPASALALPASAFPSYAVLRSGRAAEKRLEQDSGLHTIALTKLNHLLGYLQVGTWRSSSQTKGRTAPITIRYMASLFATASWAQTAYGDAQASLWELGRPLAGANTIDGSRVFRVAEKGHLQDTYVLMHRGSVESEIRLTYDKRIDQKAKNTGFWYLRHAALAAWGVAGRVTYSFPIPATPASLLPDIFASPPGTGPVVKSPSLMVLGASNLDATAHIDAGAFRSKGPPLAAHAARHLSVIPIGGLSRYVKTASTYAGTGWYDTAELYANPGEASQALARMVSANEGRAPRLAFKAVVKLSHVATADEARGWTQGWETVLALRVQNVLLVLAGIGQGPAGVMSRADSEVTMVPTWLHAQGVNVVTAAGDPVRLASINWYGAEENDFVVGGLDYQPYQAILQKIKLLGFNSIRLPISNQLVEENPIVNAHVGMNPELKGMHALDILDVIINYAGALGISIILDDHRSTAGWSTQPDGMWYAPGYPTASFVADWFTVAKRYAMSNAVIGADLRNEPHGRAGWTNFDPQTDWHEAAEQAGNNVLAANPRLLIIVEGIQYYKKAVSYWWGGSLQGVADAPVVLRFPDGSSARSQLVYSVHDYGPRLCGKGCGWFNKKTTYADLAQIWDQYWGYVAADPKQSYAAPIWVGEFGTCDDQRSCVFGDGPGSQGQWFSSLVRYIGEKHFGWSYWAINGTQSTGGTRVYGSLDNYGFLDHTYTAPYPWLEQGLASLLGNADTYATGGM